SYMKSQYTASNIIVCVAGKIKNHSAIPKIKQYFSKINSTQPNEKSKVIEIQSAPQCLLEYKKTDQTHLCLGVRGYDIFHPQRYVQDLLGIILGGMMSSRLFMEVREKLGIAYYISTSVDSNTDTGCLVTQAGVDNKNIGKAISVILKEYRKIAQKKVPKKELEKAKNYVKGKMALMLETSDSMASFCGLQELLEKKILLPEKIFKEIDKVSTNDILKTAKALFQPTKLNLALIGPFKNQDKFDKLLKQ
ncbi:insulinase family protein, partial [Candidatus Parcubacteria bacterium]|nr:insulinase family protein [Candidatus Parcubacteria bacterium]